MYVITNRKINMKKKGLKKFESTPNECGPNELRLLNVTGTESNAQVELLGDRLSKTRVRELAAKFDLDLDETQDWYASLDVACQLFELANTEKKHILLYVHGYNNDVKDVLRSAEEIEQLYNVIAVPFTWPANGGGALSGTAAYLDDKQDARTSANALNNFVHKVAYYHELLTRSRRDRTMQQASKKHPENPQAAREYYMKLVDRDCKVTINLLCHSMGNYLFKSALKPGDSALSKLVFDNVALVAADTNNQDHASWVERVNVRNRLYIVINEKDSALKWSRRKPGKEQLARLGHYLRNLSASNVYYIDVSGSKGIGSEHSYFKGKAIKNNSKLQMLFKRIFQGSCAERYLDYLEDVNAYTLKK